MPDLGLVLMAFMVRDGIRELEVTSADLEKLRAAEERNLLIEKNDAGGYRLTLVSDRGAIEYTAMQQEPQGKPV